MAAGAGVAGILPEFRVPSRPQSSSRRVRARYHRLLPLRRLENSAIHSLNTLSLSFAHDTSSVHPLDLASQPSSATAHRQRYAHRAGSHSGLAVQSRLLANVSNACRRFAARRQGDAVSVPTGADVQSPECGSKGAAYHWGGASRCASSASSPTPNVFNYSSARTFAVPLTADRASLPSVAGTLPLTDFLPRAMATRYASPDSLLRPPDDVRRAPRAVLCASRGDYVGVIKRLSDIGMIAWTRTPKAVNGIFGIPKEPDQRDSPLRLIIDARSANARFVDPPHVALPTPDIVTRITVPAGEKLYVAKVDISDFYHRVLMPEAWWPYFALPFLTAAECASAAIPIVPFGAAVTAARPPTVVGTSARVRPRRPIGGFPAFARCRWVSLTPFLSRRPFTSTYSTRARRLVAKSALPRRRRWRSTACAIACTSMTSPFSARIRRRCATLNSRTLRRLGSGASREAVEGGAAVAMR